MPSLPRVSLPSVVHVPSSAALWNRVQTFRTTCSSGRVASSFRNIHSRLSTTARPMWQSVGKRRPRAASSDKMTTMTTTRLANCSDVSEFELLNVLGRGTFGVVRLARHIETGCAVALKIVDKDQIVELRQETNILREQSVHLRMEHTFVSRLYATFQDQEAVYFVLEYCPGGEMYGLVYVDEDDEVLHDSDKDDETCVTDDSESDEDDLRRPSRPYDDDHEEQQAILRRKRSHSFENRRAKRALRSSAYGGLREPHAAFYLACLARTMEYLHEEQLVLYRDLKLENVVLDVEGYPKLIDFGLSKPNAARTRERSSTICGSMEYMAPEIVRRDEYDDSADMWSFGIVMYELLFGVTPFYHVNTREQGRRICHEELTFPNNFEDEYPLACELLRALLAKDSAARPTSFEQVRASRFFQQYFPSEKSWKQLETRQLRAPFVPKLSGAFDTTLFANAYDEAEDDE